MVEVSCASLCRERGPAGPSTSCAPSSALPVHENEMEIALPAALLSCSGGVECGSLGQTGS